MALKSFQHVFRPKLSRFNPTGPQYSFFFDFSICYNIFNVFGWGICPLWQLLK